MLQRRQLTLSSGRMQFRQDLRRLPFLWMMQPASDPLELLSSTTIFEQTLERVNETGNHNSWSVFPLAKRSSKDDYQSASGIDSEKVNHNNPRHSILNLRRYRRAFQSYSTWKSVFTGAQTQEILVVLVELASMSSSGDLLRSSEFVVCACLHFIDIAHDLHQSRSKTVYMIEFYAL